MNRPDKVAFIRDHPQLTPTQLAKAMGCTTSNVSWIARQFDLPLNIDRSHRDYKRKPKDLSEIKPGYFDLKAYAKGCY